MGVCGMVAMRRNRDHLDSKLGTWAEQWEATVCSMHEPGAFAGNTIICGSRVAHYQLQHIYILVARVSQHKNSMLAIGHYMLCCTSSAGPGPSQSCVPRWHCATESVLCSLSFLFNSGGKSRRFQTCDSRYR